MLAFYRQFVAVEICDVVVYADGSRRAAIPISDRPNAYAVMGVGRDGERQHLVDCTTMMQAIQCARMAQTLLASIGSLMFERDWTASYN